MKNIFYVLVILNLFLIFSCIDIDIVGDFSFEVEYRLEKTGTKWNKRGSLLFSEHGNKKNYKSLITMQNNPIDIEFINLLKKECELNGMYFIRYKSNKHTFYSSTNSVSNNYIYKTYIHSATLSKQIIEI